MRAAGRQKGQACLSVAVGSITGRAQVLGLLLSQRGHLHVQLAHVGFSYCFVQLLGQEVDLGMRDFFKIYFPAQDLLCFLNTRIHIFIISGKCRIIISFNIDSLPFSLFFVHSSQTLIICLSHLDLPFFPSHQMSVLHFSHFLRSVFSLCFAFESLYQGMFEASIVFAFFNYLN